MIRTTGGSEVGAPSTRAGARFSANSIASLICFIPSCSPLPHLGITDDEEVGYLLLRVLPNLLLHAHERIVHFDPETLRREHLLNLTRVREVPVRDRYHDRLHRREP